MAVDSWLQPRKGVVTNSNAAMLFCLPQAGMGAWVYQAWSESLAPEVQVLPIELPGHGSKMKQSRTTNLCQLSCQVVDAIVSSIRTGQQYALFGHSMGAWIAWEMLQEITRRGLPLPARLYVSGNRAAHLHGAEHDLDATRLHKLQPTEFWAAFERRYGTNAHLPSRPSTPTHVPLTAVGLQLDNRYTPQQMHAWKQHTAGEFQQVWLEGLGHNYITEAPATFLTMIKQQLAPNRTPPAEGQVKLTSSSIPNLG
eukprot:GHRR01021519.1.p1 GENE.GHRR01021519.1~~GHRR01021519.1.p1  ORF type:complete len:254 (+),score=65.02 GHRR01021519.1:166-927(+)